MVQNDRRPVDLSGREAVFALAAAAFLAVMVLWRVVFLGQAPVPADALEGIEPWQSEAGASIARGTAWNPLMTDSLWQVVPDGVAAHRLWSDGLPLWEPNLACGLPALAQGKMFSNPGFNLISRVTGPVRAIGWTAVLQLTMALWGAYLLLRQFGAIPAAAALAAVAFGFNLYLLVWLPHTPFFGGMVWLPMVFFMYEKSLATRRLGWTALGAVVFAVQILEGHLATPFFGAITLGLWSVVRGLGRAAQGRDLGKLVRPVVTAAALLVSGALLIAPQLLLTIELFFQTPRGEAIGAASFVALEQGFRIALPWFWGHHFHGGTYVGSFNVAETGLYFGLLPLALIVLAPLGSRRLEGWFFSITAFVCGLVVFDIPPLRAVLGWIYPILFQSFPGRLFAMSAFTGAVAAGLGAHWLLTEARPRHMRRFATAAAVFSAFAWTAAAWVAAVHRPSAIEEHGGTQSIIWLEQMRVESLLWAGLWSLLAAVVVLFLQKRGNRQSVLVWALAVVAAVDLLHVSWGITPFFPPEQILPSTPTIERLSELVADSEHSSRILPVPSQHMIPGQVPTFFQLPSVSCYTSWPLSRYERVAGLTGVRYLPWPFIYFNNCCSPMMNTLGCRFVVAPREFELRSHVRRDQLNLLRDGPVRIWENPRALPRARVVYQVRRVPFGDQDEAVRVLTSEGFRLRHQVVVEAEDLDLDGFNGVDKMRPARIVRDSPTEVEVAVDTEEPGVLVLADSWYPGWEARVNGESAAVLPTNLALRGVVVPAGASSVVFTYRPPLLIPGVVVSAFTLFGLLWIFWRDRAQS